MRVRQIDRHAQTDVRSIEALAHESHPGLSSSILSLISTGVSSLFSQRLAIRIVEPKEKKMRRCCSDDEKVVPEAIEEHFYQVHESEFSKLVCRRSLSCL